MPSARTKTAPRPEVREAGTFWAAAILLAVTWFVLIGWRGRMWDQELAVVVDGGLPLIFGETVNQLLLATLVIVVASATYLVCLRALQRGFPRAFTAAIIATILACLALLPSNLLTTPDAAHLAADVRTLWLHGRYPTSFDNVPSKVDDPVAAAVNDFRDSPSGYGPVAYAVGGAALPFVGDDVRWNIFGQKAVAALALVITAYMAGLCARRLGYNPGLVAGFVGLNPLMLWEYAGNGHNDSVMSAFAMAGLFFLLSSSWRSRAGGILLAIASVLSKFAVAPAGALVLVHWFPRLRYAVAAITMVAGLAVVALMASDGIDIATVGPAGALTAGPWRLLRDGMSGAEGDPDPYISAAYAVFLAITVYLLIQERMETERELVAAIAAMMFFFLFVGSASYLPWYQVWYLPFVALSGRRWLIAGGLAFSIGGFLVILAQNFNAVLIGDMGVGEPIDTAVVVLWLAVGAVLFGTWWYDRERVAVAAPARVRRQPLRPARKRR